MFSKVCLITIVMLLPAHACLGHGIPKNQIEHKSE